MKFDEQIQEVLEKYGRTTDNINRIMNEPLERVKSIREFKLDEALFAIKTIIKESLPKEKEVEWNTLNLLENEACNKFLDEIHKRLGLKEAL